MKKNKVYSLRKKVLITGGRSPSGLMMSRMFSASGYEVVIAENLLVTMGGVSNSVTQSCLVPAPTKNLEDYKKALIKIIKKYQIELIVPTCEEVFYISQIKKDLTVYCNVFCDDINILNLLHNKWSFHNQVEASDFNVPKSLLVSNSNEASSAITSIGYPVILKPIFSRFGSYTKVINGSHELSELNSITINKNNQWIIQELIPGNNVSAYAVFQCGNFVVYSSYSSKYHFGLGTMIYFSPVYNEQILQNIKNLGKSLNLTGSFGFDFIEKNNGTMYVLECNPRVTNGGLALFTNNPVSFTERITGTETSLLMSSISNPPMIGSAMISYAFKKVRSFSTFKKWLKDYMRGRTIIFSWSDIIPALMFPIIMLLLPFEAKKEGFSLKEMFSTGILYDGPNKSNKE